MDSSDSLTSLADNSATVVPSVDSEAEHDRWQAGIGPFEEDRQVEMLRDGVKGDTSYSIKDLFIKSEDEPNSASGAEPPDWQNWREPLARDWMNLDWSEPYRLAERLDADPPDTGVYRIWYEGQNSTLAYIGESSNIPSRLYNHEQTFSEDALFAYAERGKLEASHKRQEIETDLIGAYYLKIGEAPLAQFGYTENVPR